MSSTYRMTQNRISDAVNALYDVDYSNPTAAARAFITLVESISGGRKTIPPMLILCGILILEKWGEKNNLDENILLATRPNGYSNDELALQWLEHFEIQSRKSQVGSESY